jgi:hypothetical protein
MIFKEYGDAGSPDAARPRLWLVPWSGVELTAPQLHGLLDKVDFARF